ncbi:MAG: 50S ribosomal protein L25 [Vicinamibacteria bacterium]
MEATLTAVKRTTTGKNEARRLRAAGQLPAIVYGAQKAGDAVQPESVAVDPKSLMKIMRSESGVNTLIKLSIDGGAEQTVLVKDYLVDPVTSHLLHADFYRINMDRRLTVTVSVLLKGEAKGVKLQGGIVDFVHREVEVECLPTDIPDHIEVDITDLALGQAVHLRDVATDPRWTPVDSPDTMLVHVVAPRTAEATPEAAAAPAAAAAEPEVAKKGKTDKEGDGKDKKVESKDKKK